MVKSEKIEVKSFFEEAKNSISITEDRKELLHRIANKIVDELNDREKVNLNFICTHNSRRSQLSQVWAFYAAEYFGLNINALSGGTETTAFHRNTVKTLQHVGFNFSVIDFSHQNPKYSVGFKGTDKTILGFSKKYDDDTNEYPYIAITTCGHADENCPFIPDAIHRFHLPFTDPKASDNTPEQEATYLATNKLIAGEIFTIFGEVKKQLQ